MTRPFSLADTSTGQWSSKPQVLSAHWEKAAMEKMLAERAEAEAAAIRAVKNFEAARGRNPRSFIPTYYPA